MYFLLMNLSVAQSKQISCSQTCWDKFEEGTVSNIMEIQYYF